MNSFRANYYLLRVECGSQLIIPIKQREWFSCFMSIEGIAITNKVFPYLFYFIICSFVFVAYVISLCCMHPLRHKQC